MRAITDEATFGIVSPAAVEIASYLQGTPEISDAPWQFDIGNVSDDRRSTYACYSRVNARANGKDKLTVMASRRTDGTWSLSHHPHRASLRSRDADV
jgi:hypothetical protein